MVKKKKKSVSVKKPKRPKKGRKANILPLFGSRELESVWKPELSQIENYTRMGIRVDPNRERPKKKEKIEKEVDLPVPPEEVPNPKRFSFSEAQYYRNLIAKHGENYDAMARDMKLNFYQHNARKIETKIKLYKKYEGERLAELAEKRAEEVVQKNESEKKKRKRVQR